MIVILPREYRIKPEFCNECALSDTDDRWTPSMCDRNSWVRATCSPLKTSCESKSRAQPEIVKEAIAKRIIALAAKDERNPGHCATRALAALDVPKTG
jgi:hypothetical protein